MYGQLQSLYVISSHLISILSHTTTTMCDQLQSLYGIIQGGVYEDLRQRSTAFVNDHAFFGAAIGGSLGADKRMMCVVSGVDHLCMYSVCCV